MRPAWRWFKLIASARSRRRAVNAPHLVALVRAVTAMNEAAEALGDLLRTRGLDQDSARMAIARLIALLAAGHDQGAAVTPAAVPFTPRVPAHPHPPNSGPARSTR